MNKKRHWIAVNIAGPQPDLSEKHLPRWYLFWDITWARERLLVSPPLEEDFQRLDLLGVPLEHRKYVLRALGKRKGYLTFFSGRKDILRVLAVAEIKPEQSSWWEYAGSFDFVNGERVQPTVCAQLWPELKRLLSEEPRFLRGSVVRINGRTVVGQRDPEAQGPAHTRLSQPTIKPPTPKVTTPIEKHAGAAAAPATAMPQHHPQLDRSLADPATIVAKSQQALSSDSADRVKVGSTTGTSPVAQQTPSERQPGAPPTSSSIQSGAEASDSRRGGNSSGPADSSGDRLSAPSTLPREKNGPQPMGHFEAPSEPRLRWILGEEPEFSSFLGALSAFSETQGIALGPFPDLERGDLGLTDVEARLVLLVRECQRLLAGLPDVGRVQRHLAEANDLWEHLLANLGPAGAEMAVSSLESLSAARQMRALLPLERLFARLPNWFWRQEEDDADSGGEGAPFTPTCLASRPFRKRANELMPRLSSLTREEWAFLAAVRPPTSGVDPVEYIRSELDRRKEYETDLERRPKWLQPWARAVTARKALAPLDSVAVFDSLEGLSGDTGESAASRILQDLDGRAPAEWLRRLGYYGEAVRQMVAFGLPEACRDFDLVKRKADAIAAQDGGSASTLVLDSETFGSGAGQHPELHFVAGRAGAVNRGYVQVPLRIATSVPLIVSATVSVVVPTWASEGWPDRPPAEPHRLRIEADAWRPIEGREKRWVYTAPLTVWLRAPERRRRLTLTIQLRQDDGVVLGSTQLSWDIDTPLSDPVTIQFDDNPSPEVVERNPIGPQRDWRTLFSRVLSGQSFAVVAPRRFGKTSLLRFMKERLESHSDPTRGGRCVVIGPFSALDWSEGERAQRLWGTIKQACVRELQLGFDLDLEDALPARDAFQSLRTVAATKGVRTILILIDEAQAFFPSRTSSVTGDSLKSRLEVSWNEGPGARIVMGFAGLPGFEERGGHNLMGLLSPVRHDEIREEEIARLIGLATRDGLLTTREARVEMCRLAWNLRILKIFLEKLCRVATSEGRTWVNYDDVVAERGRVLADLQGTDRERLGGFFDDVFNAADSTFEIRWKPTLPVAMALAAAADRPGPPAEIDHVLELAAATLTEWANAGLPDSQAERVFSVREVRERWIPELENDGVWERNTFKNEMIRARLLGHLRGGRVASTEVKALLASIARRRIKVPDLTPGDICLRGAEAEVFRWEASDGTEWAFRLAPIQPGDEVDADETERLLTQLLSLRNDQGESWPSSIFALQAVGRSYVKEDCLVQQYRWVPGETLERRGREEARFSPGRIAEIGRDVCDGIVWLHSHDVWHRDISARNIVLREGSQAPVLIDFGFARRVRDQAMTTVHGSSYAAPEVQQAPPKWSEKVDVYMLARALEHALEGVPRGESLKAILVPAMKRDPRDRPTTVALREELGRWAVRERVEEDKAVLWSQLRELVRADGDKPFLAQELEKARGELIETLWAVNMSVQTRIRRVAVVLNCVLEGSGERREGSDGKVRKLSLGVLRAELMANGSSRELQAAADYLWAARTDAAHGATDSRVRSSLSRYGRDQDRRAAALLVAGEISRRLDLRSVVPLTTKLLTPAA